MPYISDEIINLLNFLSNLSLKKNPSFFSERTDRDEL